VKGYFLVPMSWKGDLSEEGSPIAMVDSRKFRFGRHAAAAKRIAPGDLLCFYLSGVGIVATAQAASSLSFDDKDSDSRYPFIVGLTSVKIFMVRPIILTPAIRSQLDLLKGKNTARWSWMVQTCNQLSRHDFLLLTSIEEP